MSETADVMVITARIEKLERENVRLKRVGLALLLCASVGLLMGQARQGVTAWQKQTLRVGRIQANRIELVTTEGQLRALLFTSPSVDSELVMFNGSDQARVSVSGDVGRLEIGDLKTDESGQVHLYPVGPREFGATLDSVALTVQGGKSSAFFSAADFRFESIVALEKETDRLAAVTAYLMSQGSADDVKRELKRELDDFKDAVCPFLRAANVGWQTKMKVDSACGLH